MAVKELVFEGDARAGLLAGVEKLASAVKPTLGPKGRNAIIDKSWGGPTVTKDGVTVAEEIDLIDKNENLGAKLVKEAASKTSKIAGDGTTTATILTEALFKEACKNLAAAIKLHPFHKIDSRLETFAFFDGDDPVFADPLEGFSHNLSDFYVVIS